MLYEFLRIATHPRVLRNPWTVSKAWSFVDAMLASPALGMLVETDRHAGVVDQVFREVPHLSGNLLHLRTPLFSCANMESGVSTPEIRISIASLFLKSSIPSRPSAVLPENADFRMTRVR